MYANSVIGSILVAVFWWPSWLDLVGCFSQWQTVCFLILVYSFLPDVDILKGKNLMSRKEYLLSNRNRHRTLFWI